jgi:hypothetical protein
VILSALPDNFDEPLSFSQVPHLYFSTLHFALSFLLAALAVAWVFLAIETPRGIRRLPRLPAVTPLRDEALPNVSILVSARDEAEKMPDALRSLPFYSPDYCAEAERSRAGEFLRGCCAVVLAFCRCAPGS